MQTQLAEKIIAVINGLAAGSGFADWGVASLCDAVDAKTQKHYLKRMHEQGFAQMGYLELNSELRFNPQELVPGASSIIVFLVPFGSNERIDNPAPISVSSNESIDNPAPVPAALNEPLQDICASQFALGQDYHKVIKKKLRSIMAEIKKLEPGFEGRAFVDSAPILERYWAAKSGLGFIGKNNFLISPKAGIRNFIGSIICNLDIPCANLQSSYNGPDLKAISADSHNCQITNPPVASSSNNNNNISNTLQSLISANACGSCHKCIDACPSGALSAPFTLKAENCISYRTIEAPEAQDTRKKLISEARQAKAVQAQARRHISIFGCDRCMDACPWNSFNLPGWPEFEPESLPIPISHFHRR